MSTRAIAPIVGVSHMQVANDVREQGVKNFTPEPLSVAAEGFTVNPTTGEVIDHYLHTNTHNASNYPRRNLRKKNTMTTDAMTALKIAANTDDHDKIRDLLTLAVETGDAPLERALRSRAASLGVIASPGRSGILAKRIQDNYDTLIKAQNLKVQGYGASLAAGQVTNDYVLEETNHPLFMANIDSLTGDAARNQNDAETALAQAYKEAATISTSTDPAQALLDETRATKIWTRIERQLKAATDQTGVLASAIADAATAGDEQRLTLAVILTEAPSHLEAHGVQDAAEIIKVIAQNANPKLLEAEEQVRAASKVLAVTRHNATVIRKATSANLRDTPNHSSKVRGYLTYDTAL